MKKNSISGDKSSLASAHDKWFIITSFHNPTTGAISSQFVETECATKALAEEYFARFADAAVSFKAKHGIDVSVHMFTEKDWTELKSRYKFKEISRKSFV